MAAEGGVSGGSPWMDSDEQRRWVIVGVCLTKVLLPALRDVLAKQMPIYYQSLLLPPYEIDKQTFTRHMKNLPHSTFRLNYESINGNFTTHKSSHRNYDYAVKDPVSLAKLFMKQFMASFTGFDQTMDLSAALSVVAEAPPFHGASGIAKKIRSDVRKEFAHCDFSDWTDVNYQAALKDIESLIKSINLTAVEEKKTLQDLDGWKQKGLEFCFGQPIDSALLNLITQDVAEIRSSVEKWNAQKIELQEKFDHIHSKLLYRIEELEKLQAKHLEKLRSHLEELACLNKKVRTEDGEKETYSKFSDKKGLEFGPPIDLSELQNWMQNYVAEIRSFVEKLKFENNDQKIELLEEIDHTKSKMQQAFLAQLSKFSDKKDLDDGENSPGQIKSSSQEQDPYDGENSTGQKASSSSVQDLDDGENSPGEKAPSSQEQGLNAGEISQNAHDAIAFIETQQKHEEIHQNDRRTWFENAFLNSRHKLKKEILEKLRSFRWLSGAYGLTGPNNKIDRPHIFLTVKKEMSNDDVFRELKEKFTCDDPTEYFELLQEPERKPKIKFFMENRNGSNSSSEPSNKLRAVSGGGVLACTRGDDNPCHVREEFLTDHFPNVQGTGTLTMFACKNGQHYALTCCHVGCANDQNRFNAAFNYELDDIKDMRMNHESYVRHAKRQEYRFQESIVENDNEPISNGDNGGRHMHLGYFHKCHFDDECDILSVRISEGIKIDCKVPAPDWDEIWDELSERIRENTGENPVVVEKLGFTSGLTEGEIVMSEFNYRHEDWDLFNDAVVVKRHSGSFLEGGDSGCPVFFNKRDNQKQVFAYGVCELDVLQLPEPQRKRYPTGPFSICFCLYKALEKVKLLEAACFNECGENRIRE